MPPTRPNSLRSLSRATVKDYYHVYIHIDGITLPAHLYTHTIIKLLPLISHHSLVCREQGLAFFSCGTHHNNEH